ncbi:hypothetical protein GGR51DRAFT_26726 [Nemania sp. FL0031]|nr:hypothetical protein GGR51DRAFT_26726 [Nemania sp. FL0031]
MCLLRFPTEIRLRIYSELLVQNDPVQFRADLGPFNPTLVNRSQNSLCPSLLCVSKAINREATPLLYSNNHFRFPDAYTSPTGTFDSALIVPYITPFLRQIGQNTHLLRHICINFPTSFTSRKNPVPHAEHAQILQFIREACTELRTVEMVCGPEEGVLSLDDIDLAAAILKVVDDGGFEAMHSLKKISVVFGQYGFDEEDITCYERLIRRVPSSKWCIELKDMGKRIWISDDDRCEFDNYEDCERYNDEMDKEELEREEEEEERQWQEEYIRRRNDPYWKNDSDYD